jgi:hypothetical protein
MESSTSPVAHFVSGGTHAFVRCSFCPAEVPAGTPEASNRLHGVMACYECSKTSRTQASESSEKLHEKLSGKTVSGKERPLHVVEGVPPFPARFAEAVHQSLHPETISQKPTVFELANGGVFDLGKS